MKTYYLVYQLLNQANDYITGEDIAQRLGISRTAVWKAIQTLEAKGLTISSIRKKGYCIQSGDLIVPDQIAQDLDLAVFYNESSQSTQLDARQGIEQGHFAPALYLAPYQEAAKGRFERPFYTSSQGGIYMSLHIKPNCHFSDLPPYTMMVAAAIVKAIQRLTGIDTAIKWVNDIYLGQKKLAGILTEAITSVESGQVTDVIIGVGFNFAISEFPVNLNDKVTSLFQPKEASITRNALITEIWKLFLTIPQSDLVKVYKEKSLVLYRQVTFEQGGNTYEGLASDISDNGQLRVTLANGEDMWLSAGEISLTSW